ncbi:MAG TPA: AAA family ATPase [Armatimonadota bacterium]|nr:AAA family ATPase [Armatimonadota bacterium]
MSSTVGGAHPTHLVAYPRDGGKPLLRAAAIFGANASGKSNLLRAMLFARDRILTATPSAVTIPVRPFRLFASAQNDRPSKFRFVFSTGGRTYDYGFVMDRERIHEEWLFGADDAKRAREQRYFERVTSTDLKTTVEVGAALNGRSRRLSQWMALISESTRYDQLFLTEGIQRGIAPLEPIRVWFRDVLRIFRAEDREPRSLPQMQMYKPFRDFSARILREAGMGIDRVSTREEPFDVRRHFPAATLEIAAELEEAIANLPPGKMISLESNAREQRVILCNAAGEARVLSFQMEHRSERALRSHSIQW